MHEDRLSRRQLLRRSAAMGVGLSLGGLGAALSGCSSGSGTGGSGRFRFEEVSYGPHPQQVADLFVPIGGESRGLITLVHGGYWTVGLDRVVMRPLARELAIIGYTAYNIDYRRLGEPGGGGGWTGTLDDTAAAFDSLVEVAERFDLDLDRHVAIGHSAGGQLAFWAASRASATPGSPGADPMVVPAALVSLSGVLDLHAAATLPEVGRLGDLRRSVHAFLGGPPDQVPDRYELASPASQLPLGIPQLVLHGTVDEIVPAQISENYANRAIAAGDDVTLTLVEGVNHFDSAQANEVWWSVVLDWIPSTFPN